MGFGRLRLDASGTWLEVILTRWTSAIAISVLPVLSGISSAAVPPPARFLRGDANGDGILSQADVITLIRYFQSGSVPACADAADFDDSGTLEITDLVNLVGFFYLEGQYPSPPFLAPGEDPTPDELGCETPLAAPLSLPRLAGQAMGEGGRVDGDEDDGQVIDFLEFFMRRVNGFPGETEIQIPILLSTSTEADGFTVCVSADPRKVWLERIDLPESYPGDIHAELSPQYTDRLREGYLARSVFMDYLAPFEGNKLPRSRRVVAGTLVFGLSPEVREGEKIQIQFTDLSSPGDARPVPFNEIVNDGRSIRPSLDSKGLEITVAPQGSLFVRGDSNRDLSINITDVVVILRYLFIGEDRLTCLDPLDVDDSGHIDITDGIVLAEFLFGRGLSPALPFPNPGLDLTEDDLGSCR
jgi:hypothetical protein